MKSKYPKKFIEYLDKKINPIDYIDLVIYRDSNDYDTLKSKLLHTRKDCFSKKDFYIVNYGDTDYYLPNSLYGILLYNFIKTLQEVDISLNRMIIITNQPNLLDQIKKIIPKDKHTWELPIILDLISIQGNNTLYTTYEDIPINTNVKRHAISMMGIPRVHRTALYNFIDKNNLKEKIAVSFRN